MIHQVKSIAYARPSPCAQTMGGVVLRGALAGALSGVAAAPCSSPSPMRHLKESPRVGKTRLSSTQSS